MTLPSEDWQLKALCRGNHAHLFFPPSTFERKDDRERRESRAKAICNVCPVLAECTSYALTIKEPFGIWGGMTEADRKEMFAASVAS
jgi:WhiB family redox-sensing transcriptional regulator